MQSTQTAPSDPSAQQQNETLHPPVSRLSNLTAATSAKRITFYKSGDAQFSGIRMAIHKRSFKCFDALLDDLSQKVPLPFGVRTITTPRGTHSIKKLEQLEDGGCYLCSDHRYVKPINMEAAGKRPVIWNHHSHPHNSRRKPSRPEEAPSPGSSKHYHRHARRIILVKNNDPAVRRSIILSRRTAHSLRAFMDESSELMQCHVRKLYTLEGRKIDNIQSLMLCPNVLVCVGREPFRPLLIESMRKPSEEKLPGMGARSRSSICSEGQESKRNVNFGPETKKSIIHPRSDSSNRSTRFSLSSEKSYSNGLCMTPGHTGCVSTCPHAKEIIRNDDIEKRVLVNKDGSLSVEMKVRFRLLNDEILQWSTEIKKSVGSVNDKASVKEGEPHYLQGKNDSSDPESTCTYEAEGAYATKHHQRLIEESHSQNCCNHCQEYDIWKNPLHKNHGADKSSASSISSHKVVNKKTSVDSMHTISRSSEEYAEHVVEKASCYQQTFEEGDTRVEYCSLSRCCSRSEVCSIVSKSKSTKSSEDQCECSKENTLGCNGEIKVSTEATEEIHCDSSNFEVRSITEKGDRPISAISNSSKVLESLKEDPDDYDDLPPSVSRASVWSHSDNDESRCMHCHGSQASQSHHLLPRPPSKVSSSSAHSLKHKKYKTISLAPEVNEEDHADRSSISKVFPGSHTCHSGSAVPGPLTTDVHSDAVEDRALSTPLKCSRASRKSQDIRTNTPGSPVSEVHATHFSIEEGAEVEGRISAISANTGASGRSLKSGVCSLCGGCDRLATPESKISSGSDHNSEVQGDEKEAEVNIVNNTCKETTSRGNSPAANVPNEGNYDESDGGQREVKENRSESAMTDKTNVSRKSERSNCAACGRLSTAGSAISEQREFENTEEQRVSAMSVETKTSGKSNCIISEKVSTSRLAISKTGQDEDESREMKVISPLSDKTNISVKSRSSNISKCASPERAATPKSKRSLSPLSAEAESRYVHEQHGEEHSLMKRTIKPCNVQDRAGGMLNTDQAEKEHEPERVSSALSGKTNISVRSRLSTEFSGTSQRGNVVMREDRDSPSENVVNENKEENSNRTPSSMSSRTDVSKSSKKSAKSQTAHIPVAIIQDTQYEQNIDVTPDKRSVSGLSNRSNISNKTVSSSVHICNVHERETSERERETKVNGNADSADMESESVSVESSTSTRSCTSNKCNHKPPETVFLTSNEAKSTQEDTILARAKTHVDDEEMAQRALAGTCQRNGLSSLCPGSAKSTMNSNTEVEDSNDGTSSATSVSSSKSSKLLCCSPVCNNSTHSIPKIKTDHVKEEPVERVASILSGRSKSSHKSHKSNQCLCNEGMKTPTPRSPVPVSFGNDQEHKTTEYDARSASSMSGTSVEAKSINATSDQDEAECIPDCKDPIKTDERPKTTASVNSVSDQTQKSGYMNSSEIIHSADSSNKTESDLSSKSRISCKTGVHLNCNSGQTSPSLSVTSSGIARSKSPSRVSQSSTKTSVSKRSEGINKASSDHKKGGDEEDKALSVISGDSFKPSKNKSDSGNAVSSSDANVISDTTEHISKHQGANITEDKSKTISSYSASKGDRASANVSVASSKTCQSSLKKEAEHASRLNPVVMPDASQNCASPAKETTNKLKASALPVVSSNDSVLSHSLSAADLREKVSNSRPISRGSKSTGFGKDLVTGERDDKRSTTDNKSGKSSIHKHKDVCKSLHHKNEECFSELMPSNLPNASPTEVVNDWLRKIPIDGPMYEMEDEFKDHHESDIQTTSINMEVPVKKGKTEKGKPDDKETELDDNDKKDDGSETLPQSAQANTDNMPLLSAPEVSNKGLPKHCHTSIQVMKVLLSPKLHRCRSLPEVSPAYGRKLSTSAKGLLDCLANLRLIVSEPTNAKDAKYNEIMNILQSLWFCEPAEKTQDKKRAKDHHSAEDDFNPRSSSGVDISSGSAGSAQSSDNSRVGRMDMAQIRIEPIAEQEATLQGQGKAELTTGNEETDEGQQKPYSSKPTEGLIYTCENPNEMTKCPPSCEKQLGNESDDDLKSPPAAQTDPPEDTSSGTPPSVQRAQLISQEPDPVWVLALLKKLESQFMAHYASAMAEFKVRWDLEDNEMLDTMIRELKSEVQKRIQASINIELKKIQSRGGRVPKPPANALSRESTAQTEERRKRLKVMRKKSVNPSFSGSDYSASITDFSDQRSEDEFCPCESCMKKKMASRAAQRAEALSSAPVIMDFDLRKILQMKKDPQTKSPADTKVGEQNNSNNATAKYRETEKTANLDVVHDIAGGENDGRRCHTSTGLTIHTAELVQSKQGTPENVDDKEKEVIHGGPKNREIAEDNSSDERQIREDEGTTEQSVKNNVVNGEKDDLEKGGEAAKRSNVAEEEETTEGESLEEEKTVEVVETTAEMTEDIEEVGDGLLRKDETTYKDKSMYGEQAEEETSGDGETADERESAQEQETSASDTVDGKENEAKDSSSEAETAEHGEEHEEVETVEGKKIEDKMGEEEESKEDCKSNEEFSQEEESTVEVQTEDKRETEDRSDTSDNTATEDDTTESEENQIHSAIAKKDGTTEGGRTDDNDSKEGETEKKKPSEDETDGDQSTSAESADEDNDELGDTETDEEVGKEPVSINEPEESLFLKGHERTVLLKVSKVEDSEEADVEDSGTDEKHKSDTSGESSDEAVRQSETGVKKGQENKVKGEKDIYSSAEEDPVEEFKPEGRTSDESCGEYSDNGLAKQTTKTSTECQPGSMDNSADLTVTGKLKNIHSLMESVESQGDNVMAITKLSYAKESRQEARIHRHTDDKELVNGITEWSE